MPIPPATAPPPVLDVRETPHDDVLARAERALSLRLDRSSSVYGESGATEGFRSSNDTWVRIERRRWNRYADAWVGLEASGTITGVRKPAWLQASTWHDPARGVVWRADEVELVTAPVVGDLATAARLPDQWWVSLRSSLRALAAHATGRVGMGQAHVTRRITEVFPDVDRAATEVDEWATAHTDLHWGNLTTGADLIDWEDWGRAPRGVDAACLWQASLPDPELADRVLREFADDLDTRSGVLALLVQCANAIRVAARRGAPTPLSEPARAAAAGLVARVQSSSTGSDSTP